MTAYIRSLAFIGTMPIVLSAFADRGESWGGGMGAIPYFDQTPGWQQQWTHSGSGCEHDVDGSGAIDVGDLLAVIGGWGSSSPDLNDDGLSLIHI